MRGSLTGLPKGQPLLVSREEMKAAWEATAPELQAAMRWRRRNIRAFAEAQKPEEWMMLAGGGREDRADCSAAGERGVLCAGRAVSAAFDAADDGDAGAGGGGGADCGVLAEAREGDAGGGVAGGGRRSSTGWAERRRSRRWRTGRRRLRGWTRLWAREICM